MSRAKPSYKGSGCGRLADAHKWVNTDTHEKWHVAACFKNQGVAALLNGFA